MGTRSAPACEVGSIGGAAGFVGERYGMGQLVDMRLLAERSPGGLFATDLSGVCLYVNPAGDAICGSEAGRSVGRPWAEALRLEDPGIVMASWREVASAGYGGVFLIRTPEGAQRWIEVRTAPAADTEAESGGHSGIILDVTDAWVMERRVTTRDAVTRILASPVSRESACEGILREIGGILGWGGGVFWELDAQGKSLHAGATWLAPGLAGFEAAVKNSAFTPGEGLPGRVWSGREPVWIADVTRDRNFPRMEAALLEGLHGAFGFPVLLGDETFGVMEFFCKQVREPDADLLQLFAAIGSQIGQYLHRKRQESDLRQSEERLRLVARHIGEALWIVDPSERRVLYLSHAYEAIWGRSAGEMKGDPGWFLEMVHSDDRSRAAAFWERVFRGERTAEEFRIVRPDGTVRWIRDLAFPVRTEGGGLGHVVGVAVDITEWVRRNEERSRAAKAEAIAVLAGGLAHDLNNLMTGVLGGASIAMDMMAADHPARSMLRNVLVSGERAAAIVAQMLAYSGKGRLVDAEVDISKTAGEFWEEVRRSVPSNVRLETRLANGLPAVKADPDQIRQLMGNLYVNAIEAIGDGRGTVTIATGLERAAAGEGLPAGEYVYLRLSDDGCGIDEKIRPRLFDPFFTTKFIGRGLGLPAAQGIARAHGGDILVSSEVGKGSVFTCLLPVER